MVSLKLGSILKPEKYIFKLPSENALINETEIKEDCFFILEIIHVGLGKLSFVTDTQLSVHISSTPAFPYRMGSLVR